MKREQNVKNAQIARGDWHPIDTAPKDGTEFLAYGDGVRRVSWWTPGWFHGFWTKAPTYWMPLPDPPTPSSR